MKTRSRRSQDHERTSARSERSSHWIIVGTLVACAMAGSRELTLAQGREPQSQLGRTSASQGQLPVRRFDIAPGSLEATLAAFQTLTGVTFAPLPETLRTLPSPGASGVYTLDQALRQLLEGTGSAHRFTAPDAVTIELRVRGENVVVTARNDSSASPKYTEPLRDVPQTITVVPQSVIQAQGVSTLRDVLRNVTGISIQAGEGGVPAGDNLTIRGFSARTDMSIDGVRDFGGYSRDPFNVEQVEVTKGPASSYAGRGSTGGSINLVSKSATLAPAYSGTLGIGTSAYKRGTADVNQPLTGVGIAGTALRFNAMWTDADVAGRDAVTNSRWGLAPSVAFGLATPTRVKLGYSYLNQDNLPDYGLPWVPNTNVPLAVYADQPAPVDYTNFYGLTQRDYENTRTGVASAQFEHDWGTRLNLRSLLRSGRTKRDSVITAPRFASTTSTDINRQLQSRDMLDTILADQTDLRASFGNGAVRHALVAGFELDRETSENFARTAPAAPLADFYHPDPSQAFTGPITRTGAVNRGAADSAGVYVFDTVKLRSRWELTGGLRFDRFHLDYDSTAVGGVITPFERTDAMLSWRAGAVFKPRTSGSIYVGYGTAFNPSAEGLTLSVATADLEPETSHSFELGTKWDLVAGRLGVNAALFRTEKTNARTPGVNAGDPPTVLSGRYRVDGVELGATGNLTKRWTLFAGYTHMRSEIDSSNTPTEVGEALGNTPAHSLRLWTTFYLPWEIEVGGGAQFVDQRFNGNTGARSAPGYWLIDATLSRAVSGHLGLRLNAQNLADERYIDRVGGGHFIPGSGRSILLTADVKF